MRQTTLLPADTGQRLLYLDPSVIDADPEQPRREFDPAGLRDLMGSIASVGLIEPLVVTPGTGGRWRLVAGERRLRAIRMGIEAHPENPHFRLVPVLVRPEPPGELERIRMQLDENRVRENLTPGEIAGAYRAAKLVLEVQEAEKYLAALKALPDSYDPGAPIAKRRSVLAKAMRAKRQAWPNASWTEVFAALGQPADRRVLAILRISDDVLARCDKLGLTKSAAASLAELSKWEDQMAVLDAVAAVGDPSLVSPVVEQMLADPSLDARGALNAVLDMRQAVREAGTRRAVPNGQAVLPKPPCPGTEFARIAAALRDAIAMVGTYALTEYQAGSVRLLATRLLTALGERKGEGCSALVETDCETSP